MDCVPSSFLLGQRSCLPRHILWARTPCACQARVPRGFGLPRGTPRRCRSGTTQQDPQTRRRNHTGGVKRENWWSGKKLCTTSELSASEKLSKHHEKPFDHVKPFERGLQTSPLRSSKSEEKSTTQFPDLPQGNAQ